MSEPTGPLPVLTDTAALVAIVNLAITRIEETQDLIRRDIAKRGDLTELVMATVRLAEIEDTFRKGTTQQLTRAALEGPPLAPVPAPVPGSHRRKRSRRDQNPRQGKLWAVPGVVIAAFAGLKEALRHSSAAHAIGAHGALKAALATTALTATGTALVVGVVTLAPNSSPAGTPGGSGPAPAASAYAASPFGPVPVAALTRPKTGTADADRARLTQSGVLPPPPATGPSSTSPSSQPAQQSQPAASAQETGGPAVLVGVPSNLDLTSGTPVTFTLTAGGISGWVSWRVVPGIDPATGVAQTDLNFSPDHGVLQAGQTVQVIVSVDASQATDGNASESFMIGGQEVAVTLPAPMAPAVAPTPSPTDTPSTAAPDPSSS